MVEDKACKGIKQADNALNANKLDSLYKYHGDKTPQLRWFILSELLHGSGVGKNI